MASVIPFPRPSWPRFDVPQTHKDPLTPIAADTTPDANVDFTPLNVSILFGSPHVSLLQNEHELITYYKLFVSIEI